MYGGSIEWDEELLLERIGDDNIFKYYIPAFSKIDTPFSSPFREDKNPSCSITEHHGRLWFKDFGDPYQQKAETCIRLIGRIYGLSYKDAIEKIRHDISGNPIEYRKTDYKKKQKSKDTIIKIKKTVWTKDDERYWLDYGIDTKLLDYANISSISNFWIINAKGSFQINSRKLSYSFNYYWSNGIYRRKIYQPEGTRDKWFSNVDSTVVQGWNILPKQGDLLIITKSFKDVLVLRNENYYSIASNNEKSFIPDLVFDKLKKRWNKIVIWYDNDDTGLVNARLFSDKYNIPYITTEDKEKDPSDYRKRYGQIKFRQLLKELL